MPRRGTRDEWLHDIEARQRNIVFPDTANNEGRFWRNIAEGKRRLTAAQRVGIGILGLAVVALAYGITFAGNNPLSPDFSWGKLLVTGINWLIAFGILAVFLLLFRVSQRSTRK